MDSMTLILLVILIWIALFACVFVKGDVLAPAFIFSAVFVFSALWLLPFSIVWDVKLHFNTLCVIVGGVLIFDIFCMFQSSKNFKWIFKSTSGSIDILPIEIKKSKMILFIIIQAFTILYSLRIKLTFAGGSFATLFATMSSYRASILIYGGKMVEFPKWLNLSNSAVAAAGFWFEYILVNNYITKKKIDSYPLVIFGLCIASTVFSTSRGGTFDYLMAFITYYIVLYRKKNNLRRTLKAKTFLKISIVLIVFIFTFQAAGGVIGRGSTETTSDYLARYCGAQIANLDVFLQGSRPNNEIWGSQTFIYIIRWVGSKIGISNSMYNLDLPFIKVNGKNLGNVYTTFYPYIYDFGYIGFFLLTAIMAIITQEVYKNVLRTKFDYKPSRYILLYGFMLPSIAMSFFSNKFYEKLFNPSFMYTFIFWIIFEYIFCKSVKKR